MKLLIPFILFVARPTVFSYKFPENFKRCHKNDPDLDNCLKSTIQNALQLIGSTGIPSLNIPPLDPIEITRLEIGAGNSAVQLVQRYFDLKVFGLSKGIVDTAHLDIDKKMLTLTVHVPKLEQNGKYDVNGKIMVVPVFGKGNSIIILSDLTITNTITFEEETKDNKSYFKIKSYVTSIDPNMAHYNFENLFNGDERLAANILKVLNDNWRYIYLDVKDGVDKVYSEVFRGFADHIFDQVPVDDIFLN